ncbi:MAG: glycosyltransferase family 4 protein, partial [Pyrinomonadaceae bacterium]
LARRAAIAFGNRRHGVSLSSKTRAVLQAIRDWRIDLVHSGTSLNDCGARAAREAGVPHVWHIKECVGGSGRVHFPLPDEELARHICGLSARVVVMSEYIARFFRRHDCRNLEVLPDGVDLDPYTNGTSRRLRAELGIGDDRLLVGMVASLASTWKQHEVFIRMAGELAAADERAHFLLIGPQPRAHRWPHELPRRYYEGLLKLARERVPAERITFMDTYPDTPDIMRSLDVLVHPCSVEPFGRIAIEAMAAGTPVVGPLTGGIAETVTDGETGLLVKPRDHNAFAEATALLLDSPELRARMGEAGRRRAEARYRIGLHAERQTAIYEQVMAERVGTASKIPRSIFPAEAVLSAD